MALPFPPGWKEILERNVSLYRHLPDALKKQLHGLVQVFVAEKSFEGCGGLEITDEIKITIAAQACILLLNRQPTFYPKLVSILVYPRAYIAEHAVSMGSSYVREQTIRAGESWSRGIAVLAWDHVKAGAIDCTNGHNVVLHEFAHQLDQEDGLADGTPILERRASYAVWIRILTEEYQKLRVEAQHHIRDVMDSYGATNPAEFFAVATEAFFEKPRQLKRRHPELYEELKTYYRLDPVEWN